VGPLRVLLELDSSDVRKGAIRNALDLAQAAEPFGFSCILCGRIDRELETVAHRLGVAISPGRSRMFSRRTLPLFALSAARWMVRLRQLRPDVVHLNYLGWGPSLEYAAHISGIPVVSRAGAFHHQNPGNRWVHTYVANSEAHARSLLDSPLRDRVVVTGPLVRLTPSAAVVKEPALPPKRPGRCRLLFIGQVVERKGVAVLLDALVSVRPEADLMLIGGNWNEEPFARQMRDCIRQLHLDDRVQVFNHRTDVAELLRTSDILVVPSLQDTLPRVVIEAMFAGVPVIATTVGAMPTIVEDNVTGVLVEAGNSNALAAAINRLVASPERRAAFGRAGRVRAETHLRPETTLERYAQLYRSLASGRLRKSALRG
jgi:glycosyltransferase involved in cell wall biosynthesis